jgi:hypothetical protein
VTRHERKRVTCHENSHESVPCHAPRGGGGGDRKAKLKWGGVTGHGNTEATNVGVEEGVGAQESEMDAQEMRWTQEMHAQEIPPEETRKEESRKEPRGAEQREEASKSRKEPRGEPRGAQQRTREAWQEAQVHTQPCALKLACSLAPNRALSRALCEWYMW